MITKFENEIEKLIIECCKKHLTFIENGIKCIY